MLTQKKLAQLIAHMWTMSASMNAAGSTNQLVYLDGMEFAPVRPDWLTQAALELQEAAEDLESLLDDETPVEPPPRTARPILAVVKEDDDGVPQALTPDPEEDPPPDTAA